LCYEDALVLKYVTVVFFKKLELKLCGTRSWRRGDADNDPCLIFWTEVGMRYGIGKKLVWVGIEPMAPGMFLQKN